MNNLSIERLKQMRTNYYELQYENVVIALDELIAIRELKGDQVPVAEIKFHPSTDKHPCMYWFGKQDRDFPVGTQFFTAPPKPVLPDELREDILRCVDDAMNGCNSLSAPDYAVRVAGWLSKHIEAAGGIVSTSDERLMQDMSGIVKDGE